LNINHYISIILNKQQQGKITKFCLGEFATRSYFVWVNQESQTYSLKEETTDKIPIAPFTTVHIKQLRATYGPIIVRSTYTEIDEVPMKSN